MKFLINQTSKFMRRLFTTLLFSALVMVSFAQTITGTVLDSETGEPLIGASVLLEGTNQGVATDFDGMFELTDVEKGEQSLLISYTGYSELRQAVTVADGSNDLGKVMLNVNAVGLAEVNVIASIAVDRKTPVAVTTIKGETVEALVGNQEYPEILRKTPSIYVTKQGGGFGDARINVRGFDQNNIAVMINGIPVNDMENGWVYWSNWAGLSDVTSSLQVQRGLGATKLAVPSVGGSINIITNAADFKKGGNVSIGLGNDGFQKYGVMLSSGKTEKGFAATAQFTHTRGDGYVDGTAFRAYSYFLSLSQDITDNSSISFSVVGAPQWHHQRLSNRFDRLNVGNFLEDDTDYDGSEGVAQEDRYGRRFNTTWGMLDGKEFNWRRNFYHKPKAFLNHYWTINDKTSLKTSAYVSLGRGGGTGPRGRIQVDTSGARIFDSFSGLGAGIHDANGQVRFDDLVAYNQGQEVAGFGDADSNSGFTTSSGDGFIRRASMNSHNWYGALSTLTHDLNSKLTLTAGLDLRYYKGIHYRRLENLLGNQFYLSRADDNNPANEITDESAAEFGNFSDNSYKDGNNVLNYWNDGLVNWTGLFAQVEYSDDKISAFLSGNVSNQGFKRIDYFNYLDSDPARETDWQNFLGGNVKAGVNYNIDDNNNVFFNTGFISKQPLFDNVFINFVNEVNETVENQNITAFEAGYGYRSGVFNAKFNAYFTKWTNRQFDETVQNDLSQDILFNYTVDQTHTGIELEFDYTPIRTLTFRGMLSVGNWVYSDDFVARGNNVDTQTPEGEFTIFGKDLRVGDAAQTTLSLGANYEIVRGFNVYADYYLADNLYANFDVTDSDFRNPNPEVVKIPSYSLVDAGLSYKFPLADYDVTFRFNVNNLFDTWYISELFTNNTDDLLSNRGFVGFGRTWNAGLKFRF